MEGDEIVREEYDFSKGKKNPYAKKLKKQITIRIAPFDRASRAQSKDAQDEQRLVPINRKHRFIQISHLLPQLQDMF